MNLNDEQMAGQRLVVGFDGTELSTDLKYLIENLHIGGLILFKRNIVDPDQIRNLCHSVQDFAKSCGEPALFISIDQEGGTVARLKRPFTEFPGNVHMRGEADAISFAEISAQELTDVGINMNMAPVLDVAIEPQTSIMKERAFGSEPEWVTKMGMLIIQHLQQRGVMAVAKHFPGIGRTTLDSHVDLPYVDTDAQELATSDIVPFREAIRNNVAGMMLAHICYRELDDQWPASLSKKIARNILRHRMGYDGVVMTDDLDMGAVRNHYDIHTILERILLSEIDIALICHRSPDIETAFETIVGFQTASLTNRDLCQRSVARLMRLKQQFL